MPRISQPYYALHQIITGQLASDDKFVLADGSSYIGSFHILPTGQRFSGFQPEPTSVEIFEKRLNSNQAILRYNQITGNSVTRSNPPISYSPFPTFEDYKKGKIQRMFVQKRNSALNTILEIDAQQYNSINTLNNPGINGVIYNKLLIEWVISKIPVNDASYLNSLIIQKSTPKFPHIGTFLTNTLEFYK